MEITHVFASISSALQSSVASQLGKKASRRETISISSKMTQDSPQTLEQEFPESGRSLNIFFHLSSSSDEHPIVLDAILKMPTTNIPLSKPIRFVFHALSNVLKISLRAAESLVELSLWTRDTEPIRGTFYQWTGSDGAWRFSR